MSTKKWCGEPDFFSRWFFLHFAVSSLYTHTHTHTHHREREREEDWHTHKTKIPPFRNSFPPLSLFLSWVIPPSRIGLHFWNFTEFDTQTINIIKKHVERNNTEAIAQHCGWWNATCSGQKRKYSVIWRLVGLEISHFTNWIHKRNVFESAPYANRWVMQVHVSGNFRRRWIYFLSRR